MHINERLRVNFWKHSGVREPLGFPFYSTILNIPRNPNACHAGCLRTGVFLLLFTGVCRCNRQQPRLPPFALEAVLCLSLSRHPNLNNKLSAMGAAWRMWSTGFDSSTSQTGYQVLLSSNSGLKEVDVGRSAIQGHPQLHRRFQASLNYRRPYLKNKAKQ